MFDIGFWELALVGLISLLVFGPERLPRVAREAALWLKKARRAVATVKDEINHELELQDLKQVLAEQKKLTDFKVREQLEKIVEEPAAQALDRESAKSGESVDGRS
jgi:sec-independent protein translocase protein TatB